MSGEKEMKGSVAWRFLLLSALGGVGLASVVMGNHEIIFALGSVLTLICVYGLFKLEEMQDE